MRRKLKNFRNKNGHSENGAPRQLLDEAVYREHAAAVATLPANVLFAYDSNFSGWSNPSRPRDQAISLRATTPVPPG